MKKKQPLLSVIIPVFNEQKRLKNIKRIISYLHDEKISSEVILVNDGSNKKTVDLLNNLDKRITVLHSYPNRGKGFAVKQGILSANGKYSIFMDIDLSTPIDTVPVFLTALKKYQIVVATRKSTSSKITTHQPFLREMMGKSFTLLSQMITGVSVSDFTCGFKAFSTVSAKKLFSSSRVERWSFDAEILFLAKRRHITIKEIPVRWKNDEETKVVFPRDIYISLKELLSIRWYDFRGNYR